ncbi:ABC transporter ATP-binding protein [Thermopetrobacter sp. TC1]|uniref:ABC transporter ATP-binding protein n=1 Tax=Thermopetrobacter sp. TC1 TaxID=1495045 RepID=UPI00068F38F0|nr:ABC transporter ATP-binding protein [Thermopetrobacter sp. TC1]
MIRLEHVTRIHNEGRPNAVVAVNDVSLEIPKERVTVLRGPSGSGKTTLLTLIGCLARPTQGRIWLDDELISALPERFMTEVRRRTFGFIFQRFNLIRGLSALENVMLPAYPTGESHAALKARAAALLERFGLKARMHEKSELLSGGEAQRVAIARALINDPAWIIADEPTASLDTALVDQFIEEMRALKKAGKSIIITSHDPRIWQADVVDRIVTMQDGHILSVEDVSARERAEEKEQNA